MSRPLRWIPQEDAGRILASGTNALRLAWGGGDQVERFGQSVLISLRQEPNLDAVLGGLDEWCGAAGWSPSRVYLRRLVRGPGEADVPRPIRGGPPGDPRETVRESGLVYEVDFSASYSPGLFCDQRSNRDFLRTLRPARVLNTFSYTCAFSVAAASAGARTVSVDVSKSSLQRGRRNFELSGMDLSGHAFVPEDVPTYLRRLARRGEEPFDAIILDPPTFGRGGGGKSFRVERDFPELLALASALAAPGTAYLLSTNFSRWSRHNLEAAFRSAIPGAVRMLQPAPAPDYREESPSVSVWALT